LAGAAELNVQAVGLLAVALTSLFYLPVATVFVSEEVVWTSFIFLKGLSCSDVYIFL
jgi:hypothetical protein